MASMKQLIDCTKDPEHGEIAKKLLRSDFATLFKQLPDVLLMAELDLDREHTEPYYQAVLDAGDVEAMVRLVRKGHTVSNAISAYRKELNRIAKTYELPTVRI